MFDGVKKRLKHAVEKLTEPVRATVREGEHLLKALTTRYNDYLNGERTGMGPVHGGTNWDAYHHRELYDFVHVGASPGQVTEHAGNWAGFADELGSTSDTVGRRRDAVRTVWHGAASDVAGRRMQGISDHASAAKGWTAGLANQLKTVAAALETAKSTMPTPPDHPLAAVFADAAVAGASGGPSPLGGVRALAGAGLGTFEQHQKNLAQKKIAIKVMRKYESAIMACTFSPPPSAEDMRGPLPHPHDESTGSTRSSAATPPPNVANTFSANGNTGVPAATSSGFDPAAGAGRWTAPAVATTATTTTAAAGATPGATRRPAPGTGSWQRLVGGGATGGYPGVRLPDLSESFARQGMREPGVAKAGRPGMPGPLGGGRGRRREEDKEHVNTLPVEYNLFAADEPAAPSVIGDNDDR